MILDESTQQALIGNNFSITTGILLIATRRPGLSLAKLKEVSPRLATA